MPVLSAAAPAPAPAPDALPALSMGQDLAFKIVETEIVLTRKFYKEKFVMNYPLTNRFQRHDVHQCLLASVGFAQELARLRAGVCQDIPGSIRDILTRMRAYLAGVFDEEVLAFRQRVLALVDASLQEVSSYSHV
jgi:hypothetical protein